MSGLLVPVVEGGGTYGRGATEGGTSARGGVAGGATAGGAAGGGVTGGGTTEGEGVAGGATAHPMTVLSIPRLRKITRRRDNIRIAPCVSQCPWSWQRAKTLPCDRCLTSTRKPLCTLALHGRARAHDIEYRDTNTAPPARDKR
jgi:hypothetical protein